jgi:hypothetical protein
MDWDPDRGDPMDDHFSSRNPVPAWPAVPPVVPAVVPPGWAAGGDGERAGRPPPGGLLDLTLSWVTLIGEAERPGRLGRIGPVTAVQARELARLAARVAGTEWRVIVTDADRRALTVGRLPALRVPRELEPGGVVGGVGVVGRVTVVMTEADADRNADRDAGREGLRTGADQGWRAAGILSGMAADVLDAARWALARAREAAEGDRRSPEGCAHAGASAAYRPPQRLREQVIARDQTCRYPSCGQPAWRGDLDHTHPWDKGGKTCRCNLGGLCRRHHRLKQLPGWHLGQPQPGTFAWTTPAGLTYAVRPDPLQG